MGHMGSPKAESADERLVTKHENASHVQTPPKPRMGLLLTTSAKAATNARWGGRKQAKRATYPHHLLAASYCISGTILHVITSNLCATSSGSQNSICNKP